MNANVIIIGGGPAGIITAFDDEFCDQIYEVLIKAGVKVHTGNRVVSIDGNKTVRELDMMQITTHPLLTSAPAVHPVINAAHQALANLRAASSQETSAFKKGA